MQRNFLIIALLLLSVIMTAQAPNKMSYQAVIRDASNNLITNTNVGVRVSILQGSSTGTAVYEETHTATTNSNGLISLEVGAGTVVSGTFSSITWSSGNYYIKTETDPTGGNNYTISGTSQLLSVPYAMYATSAGSSTTSINGTANYLPKFTSATALGNSLLSDNGTKVGLGTNNTEYGGNFEYARLGIVSENNDATDLNNILVSNDSFSPWINWGKARGTLTSKAIVQNNDQLFLLTANGHDGTNFQESAKIEMKVDGAPATNSIPSKIIFSTTTVGNTGPNERMIITNAGNIGVGTSSPSEKLEVNGKTKVTNLQVTDGANAGYVLQSDASGNATWANPTTLSNGNWTTSGTNQYSALSGNVGIGTSSPSEKLHVEEGNLINTGTFGSSATLTVSGAGTRMFFYPLKAAFRAGYVSGTNWDSANIGNYSTAMGYNNKASGTYSTSIGGNTNSVSGSQSSIIGGNGNAVLSQNASVVGGDGNSVTGNYTSILGGMGNAALSQYGSILGGKDNSLTGNYSTVIGGNSNGVLSQKSVVAGGENNSITGINGFIGAGYSNSVVGSYSFTTGNSNIVYGNSAFVTGEGNTGYSFGETVLGLFGTSYTANGITSFNSNDRVLNIGIGTSTSSRADALTVLKSGNVGIGTSVPTQKLEVSGTTKTTNLQVTTGATNGYVLQSDASGNGTWVNPTTLSNGNWTTSGANQYNALSGNVGLGVTSPLSTLDITGTNAGSSSLLLRSGNTSAGTSSNQIEFGYNGTSNYKHAIKTRHNSGSDANNAIDFYVWDQGTDASATTGTKNAVTITSNDTGRLGVATSSPNSTLDVQGTVGAKFKSGKVAGTDNPDATAMTWRYNSGTGTITLPTASTCTDRIYVIINQTGATRTISSYRDLTTTPQTTLGSSVALWLQSDGTEWWQIK